MMQSAIYTWFPSCIIFPKRLLGPIKAEFENPVSVTQKGLIGREKCISKGHLSESVRFFWVDCRRKETPVPFYEFDIASSLNEHRVLRKRTSKPHMMWFLTTIVAALALLHSGQSDAAGFEEEDRQVVDEQIHPRDVLLSSMNANSITLSNMSRSFHVK